MQSRPTDDSQNTYPSRTHNEADPSSKYGFQHSNERSLQRALDESDRRPSLLPEGEEGHVSNIQDDGRSITPLEVGLRAGSPYESPTPLCQTNQSQELPLSSAKDPGNNSSLQVSLRPRKSDRKSLNLVDIPNEVLTHILSHLSAEALSAVSLVSHDFNDLVTTPHAWRIAFSRYFPASERSNSKGRWWDHGLVQGKPVFTRLTALASWRSEYILRTRLMRSLARGRPSQLLLQTGPSSTRAGALNYRSAQVTYNSKLLGPVNHIEATFGGALNKRLPRFIHASDDLGVASFSDPVNAKVDSWGSTDPQIFPQFAERFPGDTQYGLGLGDVVGVPNSMDVSQPFGIILGQGIPGGLVYHRSTEDHRGFFLPGSRNESFPELGIPRQDPSHETVCSVWIAKTTTIPSITEGIIGMLAGSSYGTLTSYSLGTNDTLGRRLERGEITARWVLSPGVPITSIEVDEDYSAKRYGKRRIWAVVLNALGEVFHLTAIPRRSQTRSRDKLSEPQLDQIAWETGRSVFWALVEPTRRKAIADPYQTSSVDGSYSPRSSWLGMGLSANQIAAESKEIERYIPQPPKYFQAICEGWDMRRRLEVDFAADDENDAGEIIFVISCGLDESTAEVKRYSRHKLDIKSLDVTSPVTRSTKARTQDNTKIVDLNDFSTNSTWSFSRADSRQTDISDEINLETEPNLSESWRTTDFLLGNLKASEINTTTVDKSSYAVLTISEDPLLSMSASNASSSWSSPSANMPLPGQPSEVPGQRSRLIAAGTSTGAVLIWNMRAPSSGSAQLINSIRPTRIIHTDSPQISCLGLTSLYLVHGGNDGLVQVWDPLESVEQPIRTINSRYSSRARRRIAQAEASIWGVGLNLFAAGAICLDPDPKSLRGMVSLGAHLRYWSYNSTEAENYKASKRRLKRSGRKSNQGGERFHNSGRGALNDYIVNERLELEQDKKDRRRERERLVGRFGVGLLGTDATEDEIMAYATMLSEEAAQSDQIRRASQSPTDEHVTGLVNSSSPTHPFIVGELEDPAMVEAIRLSLEHVEQPVHLPPAGPSSVFPVRFVARRQQPPREPRATAGANELLGTDDLKFALQLSLAEQKSKIEAEGGFPALASTRRQGSEGPTSRRDKGKGKERSSY